MKEPTNDWCKEKREECGIKTQNIGCKIKTDIIYYYLSNNYIIK